MIRTLHDIVVQQGTLFKPVVEQPVVELRRIGCDFDHRRLACLQAQTREVLK